MLFSCSKKESQETTPTPSPVTPSNPPVQDSRFIGGWVLDSIRGDSSFIPQSQIHLIPHLSPPCDSMVFSSNHFVGYGWASTYYYSATSMWDKWDTPYSDSLFIHAYSAQQVYIGYKYTMGINKFTLEILQSKYYYNRH